MLPVTAAEARRFTSSTHSKRDAWFGSCHGATPRQQLTALHRDYIRRVEIGPSSFRVRGSSPHLLWWSIFPLHS